MKIYRFKNGDRCPCCGQTIWGKTPEELAEFSITVFAIGSQLGLADWILRPEADAIEISSFSAAQSMHKLADALKAVDWDALAAAARQLTNAISKQEETPE